MLYDSIGIHSEVDVFMLVFVLKSKDSSNDRAVTESLPAETSHICSIRLLPSKNMRCSLSSRHTRLDELKPRCQQH
jgi:hypothetical protein